MSAGYLRLEDHRAAKKARSCVGLSINRGHKVDLHILYPLMQQGQPPSGYTVCV